MIRIKNVLPLLILLFALPLAAQPLRIATEGAYPPFSYFDAQGELTGFDVDIARALCDAMERECEIIAVPWTDLLPRIQAGDFQVIVASMARTPQRERHVDFTDYYYRSHSMFAGDPARFGQITPEALQGLKLAAGRGTVQADYLRQTFPLSHLVFAADQEEVADLLVRGEVDLILSDSIHLLNFLQTDAGARFDFIGTPVTSQLLQADAHIAVQKGDQALLNALNQALVHIRLDGTYEQINRRYVPFSIY